MRFDSLTIFLFVLIVFVLIILLTNWFTCEKETFISFHSDITNGNNIGQTVYIPQYSSPDTKTVITLYDSLYFDYQNGTLIEVYGKNSGGNANDVTGTSITEIAVAPRDGSEIINYRTQYGSAGYSTNQSLVTLVSPSYNQFQYTTMSKATDIYQALYISWHTNTYIHLINLSSTNMGNKYGRLLYTYILNTNGLINSVEKDIKLPDFTSAESNVKLVNQYYRTPLDYLNGREIYNIATTTIHSVGTTSPIGTESPTGTAGPSSTLNISYDISYGNIVITDPASSNSTIVYNRSGNGIPSTTVKPDSFEFTKVNSVFKIDFGNASVLVIANNYDTIISIITPSTDNYNLLTSVRFNRTQLVSNITSDTSNNMSNNKNVNGNSYNEIDIVDDIVDDSHWKNEYRWGYKWDNTDKINSVCDSEISCKWYWFFNSIGQNNMAYSGNSVTGVGTGGKNILSDDYFLKTEVVPPVCPQCPMCPDSGVCGHCGGTGGSGTCNSTSATGLTPSPTVPGTFKDASGNVFVLYTDSNGNKSYIPQSRMVSTNAAAAGSNSSTAQNATFVNANGEFVTTADPNTIGGGLAISTMSLDQLGTSAFNNTGSVANNLIGTTGNVANTVVDTAGGLAGGVLNLAGNALGDVTSLAKGAGNGLMQLGSSNGSNVSGSNISGPNGSSYVYGNAGGGAITGYTPNTSISDKNFGNIQGQTQIDNYSYYGALQSKGGNYMPVTADFSSFRK